MNKVLRTTLSLVGMMVVVFAFAKMNLATRVLQSMGLEEEETTLLDEVLTATQAASERLEQEVEIIKDYDIAVGRALNRDINAIKASIETVEEKAKADNEAGTLADTKAGLLAQIGDPDDISLPAKPIGDYELNLTNSVKMSKAVVIENVGEATAQYDGFKCGTSAHKGKIALTIPVGTTGITFSAASWKGTEDDNLIIRSGEEVLATLEGVKANDGLDGSTPFTVTFEDEAALKAATYTLTFAEMLAEPLTIVFEMEKATRFGIWNIQLGSGIPAATVYQRINELAHNGKNESMNVDITYGLLELEKGLEKAQAIIEENGKEMFDTTEILAQIENIREQLAAEYALTTLPESDTDYEAQIAELAETIIQNMLAIVPNTLKSGRYFFKNMATGKFWGQANDWGTHASLVDNPEFMTLEKLEDGTYTLESNVSNGGTQYYFNGAWMDNGSPLHLTILNKGDYFTISDGNIYLGYNGSNTKMGNDGSNTGTDPEDENVMWEIVGEDEVAEYLTEATQEDPINATFFIKDANFGRNNRNQNAWVVSEECTNKNLAGGANENMCAESFHSVFTISQTIEGVPNGVYGLTAQGFYRQDGKDDVNLPVFFLNRDKATFPLKTGSENSMTDASNAFSAGKYTSDMLVVKVRDGKLTLGVKLEKNKELWCIWDNFTLLYFGENADVDAIKFGAFIEQLKTLVAQAEAMDCEDLPVVYANALTEALAAAEAPATVDEYKAAIAGLNAAIDNANNAKNALVALDGMKAEMEATNVYTAEAFKAYKAIYDNALAQLEAGTPVAVENPQAQMGWRAANTIDDLLLSAWTINDVQCKEYSTNLYINTWSVEGNTDGSEFRVPFFEYWTGDGESLGTAKLTATVTDLVPNAECDVTIWARVRIKNGAEAPATGITLDLNGGEAVDLCAGESVPGTPFYLAQFAAKGVADADGVLKININVAEENNVSWLSFKNVKYTENVDPMDKAYYAAQKVLVDGKTYRIFTTVGGTNYYLKADGYLTAVEEEAATLNFLKVAGTAFEYGFKMKGVCYTNPETLGQGTFENDGHIHTNTSQNRDTWEGQVFFLNNEGKYAVRATNATDVAWGANTYWDVFEGAELPEAGYSLEASYVWNIEEFVDKRIEALATVKTWNAKMGLIKEASKFTSNAVEPSEGSLANLLDGDYSTFFHSQWSGTGPAEDHYLQAEIEEPVDEFIIYFMKRSQNNNNRPTEIDITAGDDELSLTDAGVITEGLPTDAAITYYVSEPIALDKAYKYIRFTIPHTNNEAGNNGHAFFTFSEFNLFPVNDVVTEVLQSGYMQVTSASQLKYSDVPVIEALDQKISDMTVGVNGITVNTNDIKAIYDLAGRRVAKTTKGIFIINGKKVVK